MIHSKSAKAELTTALKAGQTSAKTATFNKKPLSKAAQAKAAQAKADNIKWERPSLVAIHRTMAGNDLRSGHAPASHCVRVGQPPKEVRTWWSEVAGAQPGMLGPLLRV